MNIIALLIFIIILSILVLVHELGHFIAAKINGIRVEEFGLGLPPKIFGFTFGETEYSLNLLPFGGFVKLTGEEEDESTATSKGELPVKDERSFAFKTPLQKAVVLCAGVFMNMVLAVSIFYFTLAARGFKSQYFPLFFDHTFRFGKTEYLQAVVSDTLKGSPAEVVGLEVGDTVISVDGAAINDIFALRKAVEAKGGEEVTLIVGTDAVDSEPTRREVKIKPVLDGENGYVIGVYLSRAVRVSYVSGVDKVLSGFFHSHNVLSYSLGTMKNMIKLSVESKDFAPVSQSVSGPVGIYNVIRGVVSGGGTGVLLFLIEFIALMSLSLAFLNILPFPALDGGRLVFVVIEGVTGKKVNQKFEGMIHKIGMAVLMAVVLLVTIKDLKLF